MSIYIGVVPFDVAPVVMALVRWQMYSVWLVAAGRYESKRRLAEYHAMSPGEQYRHHIQNGGYRP